MNTLMIASALGIAGVAAFAGSQYQKGIDHRACDVKIQAVRQASVDALNKLYQINLTLTAERDQAKSEVDKVNATTAAQFNALQVMLADDRVKREEASTRVEAAAKEAARNARTAGERATAARDLITQSTDRCAVAPMPDDIVRMLDAIGSPADGSRLIGGAMPAGASAARP